MDLLGHGASPTPVGANDLAANAAAAKAVWQGPGWVIGHSYGAAVAVRFALDHPDRVTRLVLIEPVLFALADGTQAQAKFQQDFLPVSAALAQDDLETAARHFMAIWDDRIPWQAIPPAMRAYAADRMPFIRDSAADLEQDQTGIGAAGVLEDLHVPTTLIRGENTHPVIAAVHDCLAARLPSAAQRVIADAGHMAPLTHAEAVAKAIT